MVDQKNIILAVVLSVVILFGWEIFMAPPPPPPGAQQAQESPTQGPGAAALPQSPSQAPMAPGATNLAPPGDVPAVTTVSRADALTASPRITIRSERLHGSISLKGGRIDDLTLADYRETLDPTSAEITVLSPQGTPNPYFAQFGWVGNGLAVPGSGTVWTADRQVLEPGSPVTLTWDNGQGLRFSQVISLDENYMFSVTQGVENTGTGQAVLNPYGLVSRHGTPELTGFIILHEGLLGVFDSTLKEVDYEEAREEGAIQASTTGGWLGITDKYWLAALVPDQKVPVNGRFLHTRDGAIDKYQADFLAAQQVVDPGQSVSTTNHFFAGAKEVELLDQYAIDLGVERFDLAIDFGWFYFLTKPIFYGMIYINKGVGNFGVAILILTVLIKAVLFPLANKSYTSMSKMKALQPEMKKLQERFKEDKMRLNQEMMALYKREKVNPASGCLPILVQIPVFFALYKVLFVCIEMRQAPFFGWIQDLSAPDPTTLFNLFGLVPWTPPEFLMIGVWPLIMGVTMWLQQKLNPQPTDPIQAKVFMFLPFVFTIMLAPFPAGLVIYWAWNNLLSIAQQWVIMRKMGVKA